MADYIEVQDVKEIRQYSKQLSELLADDFPDKENRTLGSPSGSWAANVRFQSDDSDQAFWWSHHPKDSRGLAVNYFGHGEFGSRNALMIDIQLNIAVTKFARTTGGTFLKKKATGEVFLAHRGIVTLGRSRLIMADVLDATQTKTVEGETGTWTQRFIIVASLGAKALSRKIENFALEIRETARFVGRQRDDAEMYRELETRSSSRKDAAVAASLAAYFQEHSGKVPIPPRGETVADRFHGDVVHALAKLFKDAICFKNTFVDLATITQTKAVIFEVKTSSKPQSVYTAVGQLLMHVPLIKKEAAGFPVLKIAVLPEEPKGYFARRLNGLGIQYLLYTRSDSGRITFQNYDDLLL
jgi:hypothetical protein